jgi:beta-lactamase regulating signal transducer with metallopeptidase domain
MMLQAMAYALAVAAALTVAGHCVERLSELHQRPKRVAWIAAMVLSVLLPLTMMLTSKAKVAPLESIPIRTGSTSPGAQPAAATAVVQKPIWMLAAPSDIQVAAMWALASAAFGSYLIGASLLLRRRAARWQRMNVLGNDVLVSEVTGPALLGVLAPRIVVPRWLLQEAPAAQQLMLEHERQHMAARDPLLMVAGLFIIAAVPWNPLLWWQWRRMRHAMELDCDARVLRTGTEAETYAEVLLEVTRRAIRTPPGALAMSEPVTALEQRIDRLGPRTIRCAALQNIMALGLAASGAGAALALDAPALPGASAGVPEALHTSVAATLRPSEPRPVFAISAPPDPAVDTETPKTPVAKPTSPHRSTNNPGRPGNPEDNMKRSNSIAVAAAALGAATAASPQTPSQSAVAGDGGQSSTAQIIASNDLNGDGIVTRQEAQTNNKELSILWVYYDTDADGRVNAAEIDRARVAFMTATAEERVTGRPSKGPAMVQPAYVIANNDGNGDGIVTKEEATKAGRDLIRLWDLYDVDKDGKIDSAEISKAQGF